MEIWKPIKGFDDYEVSNFGNVRSYKRKNVYLLKKHINQKGYHRVRLAKDNEGKMYFLHRIVAHNFIGDIENLEINHKDGNKQNNNVDNLEIVTKSENTKHAYETGLRKRPNKKVLMLEPESLKVIREFESILSAAEFVGVNYAGVSKVCSGKRKLAGGYSWRLKEDYFNVNDKKD